MRRKGGKRKVKPGPTRPVLKGYRRGGVGQGRHALVHKGEVIMRNPFGK